MARASPLRRRRWQFSLVDHAHRACRSITEQDIGKRVFALAIARDKPLSFAVYPNLQHRLPVWARNAARAVGALAVLLALVRIDGAGQILLPLGAATSTLLITLIMAPEVLTGFPTHMGGNDGLVHDPSASISRRRFTTGATTRRSEAERRSSTSCPACAT